ncbi:MULTISPECIES: Na+/H+ antiporter subunit G [unclassified Staphylococcus]|uniref:Na+/H+ antiporter subunit G n=1 Tax=unclassified Staphylococcus TaxID=91994 RepID=UPI0021D38DC9|nr:MULTISPECIES: Na+/H+ antiporter subunit G [unclassified Staphylococcus]UXR69888.1 Na+/H+ antiporter subunit G [Staphylococcus sp. IVB6246]UXR71927.1 Na+/H+ antiporter subunit G [Staphylococcus sp. IVB6240]UXR74235.1 Na+/H+ antiporter subunit G [Staphylococcus sp. IVB6238]UXR76624.1 Na+/H+ antiporter subunit G [Staphylococcus sp. IVB6233]UXR80753.1 Na+/H+ antiporter subunit G [Staphylococcus sp. IVB6218]
MATINEIIKLFAAIMVFGGSLIALISAIGVVRFRDVFLRIHAATKASTAAVLLTLVGVFIYFIFSQGYVGVRTLLALVFINITSPVGGHLVSRAAYRTGAYMYQKDANTGDADLNQDDIDEEQKRQIRIEKRAKRRKKIYSRLDKE